MSDENTCPWLTAGYNILVRRNVVSCEVEGRPYLSLASVLPRDIGQDLLGTNVPVHRLWRHLSFHNIFLGRQMSSVDTLLGLLSAQMVPVSDEPTNPAVTKQQGRRNEDRNRPRSDFIFYFFSIAWLSLASKGKGSKRRMDE